MKIKLTAPKIVNIAIGLVLLFFIIAWGSIFLKRGTVMDFATDYSQGYSSYRRLHPLPSIDEIPDDHLPQYIFSHKTDSIKMARMRINGSLSGSSTLLGPLGVQINSRCDSCISPVLQSPDERARLTKYDYLIRLNWWKLNKGDAGEDKVLYYVKNGQSYLRANSCKEIKSKDKNGKHFVCEEKDTPVAFRIDENTGTVMMPATPTLVKSLKPLSVSLLLLLAVYCMYFIIGNFVKFLIEIAQGNPFSEKNLSRLKVITLSLFYIPVAFISLNFLLYLIFHRYFSEDIVLDIDGWMVFKYCVLYLIFAALLAAFKKGKQLKEENDLTV